jgi:hypothetical protein
VVLETGPAGSGPTGVESARPGPAVTSIRATATLADTRTNGLLAIVVTVMAVLSSCICRAS